MEERSFRYSMFTFRMVATIMLFLPVCLTAQLSFTGLWKGTITSNDGQKIDTYYFEMYLYQVGEKVVGRTLVKADSLYAEIEVEGSIYNKTYLRFQDKKIVTSTKLEGMEWCLKKGHLVVRQVDGHREISGIWEGHTSFSVCRPGRIELSLIPARASL